MLFMYSMRKVNTRVGLKDKQVIYYELETLEL